MGRLFVFGAAVTSVILLSLIYAILVAGGSGESPSGSPDPSTSGDILGEITISAFDLGFEPATVDVEEPGTYTIEFKNTGAVAHDITFDGGRARRTGRRDGHVRRHRARRRDALPLLGAGTRRRRDDRHRLGGRREPRAVATPWWTRA